MATSVRGGRDAGGTVLGLATFLVGIGLLLVTFKLAYDMFSTDPAKALPLQGETLQMGLVGSTVTGLVLRVLLLLVMGVVGSLVAGRGVHMYTDSRGLVTTASEEVREVKSE